jgi:hypothetical protein
VTAGLHCTAPCRGPWHVGTYGGRVALLPHVSSIVCWCTSNLAADCHTDVRTPVVQACTCSHARARQEGPAGGVHGRRVRCIVYRSTGLWYRKLYLRRSPCSNATTDTYMPFTRVTSGMPCRNFTRANEWCAYGAIRCARLHHACQRQPGREEPIPAPHSWATSASPTDQHPPSTARR